MIEQPADQTRLFPTKTSFAVFWSYITLFVNQGILFKLVQKGEIRGQNAVIVVLLTEAAKLVTCIIIYLFRTGGRITVLLEDLLRNKELVFAYLVPASLYCLYNNLTFVNLELFDLTTYYCLMQFRIVLTGLIYQVLFRRQLTGTQWISLFILTIGCLLKEYGFYTSMSHDQNTNQSRIIQNSSELYNISRVNELANHVDAAPDDDQPRSLIYFIKSMNLLLLQMFCSCFAGVYNEYLLKGKSYQNKADVILQNIFMYFNSIFCNILFIQFTGGAKMSIFQDNSKHSKLSDLLSDPLVTLLIINNTLAGLVASFFLKTLNSILKTFASALELFAVALLAWIIFGDVISLHTVIALLLVSAAMTVYSRNPVSVEPPEPPRPEEDGFMMVSTEES